MENKKTEARIIAVHKNRFECIDLEQRTFYAQLKRSEYANEPRDQVPTVGDQVLVAYNDMGDSQILRTLPRRSLLKRLDPSSSGHYEQLLAANVDHVFMLTSANEDFNPKRIRRYMLVTQQSGATFHVVINKCDLVDEKMIRDLIARTNEVTGHPITFAISCRTGQGIDRLRDIMTPDSASVFLGSSGVGKSTLVNTLLGYVAMDTGTIREDDAKGRHTTTGRQMLFLPNGAMIIDTPGMRELGLWDAQDAVSQSFDDITALISRCKYTNCTHTYENGCQVQLAIAKGKLTRERWDEYKQLFSESRVRRIKPKKEKQQKKSVRRQNQYFVDDDEY